MSDLFYLKSPVGFWNSLNRSSRSNLLSRINMDDLTLRYYDAEMRYLLEAGEEFARAHPEQAAMLNLDKAGACDPYVERLFEGFAFLMGRLREKLNDDLPELTEGLVSLLWPHYLRTIPSMSVVEFTLTGVR